LNPFPGSHPIPPIRIVGLGLAALDILVRTGDLPTWDCGVRLQALGIDGGGPVATALVAAQRLGVQTGFIGTCGSDRLGRIKLETLSEYGVDTSHIVQRSGPEESAILVCVHEATGERIFSGASHPDFQALRVEELDPAFIISAEFLHLDGCHAEAALAAARWMRQAGKRVMLDGSATRGPIPSQMRLLVAEADVLICGSGFGPALTGKNDLWEIGTAILDMGPKIVVQTEGNTGSYTSSQTESFHTPAFEVDVLDTTGAGDVFHGAYLVGLLHGWDLRSIALFSTAVAGLKCSRLGGRQGIPTFEQTMDFLSQHQIHIS
jgi:sulfofructose kinase